MSEYDDKKSVFSNENDENNQNNYVMENPKVVENCFVVYFKKFYWLSSMS